MPNEYSPENPFAKRLLSHRVGRADAVSSASELQEQRKRGKGARGLGVVVLSERQRAIMRQEDIERDKPAAKGWEVLHGGKVGRSDGSLEGSPH